MKRVLMLGGSMYQTYAIKAARDMGYYVITCDYLPDNPGHQYAHEYYNVSTTDKDAVLALAKELKVDGIVAYASDPAAPTAAYVSEKLGLPTSPYKSVEILSKKHLFRQYLTEHGFNVPRAKSYTTYEEAEKDIDSFHLPVMVKPVDSSYSKNMVDIFTERRNALYEGLSKIDKFCVKAPEATFYMMVDISKTGMDSIDFCYALLRGAHVAAVPSVTYGQCCNHYIRIAFTLDKAKISEGVKRISSYMTSIAK